ncbi:DUF192 domain-containing protein [Rubrivirga sp.]|uniref:DUF192 domain-containing protein n=1 Tax=Rubrivirga sp. TaxID=1885344 RepID=UPI003C7308B5
MRYALFCLIIIASGCSDPEPTSRTDTAEASIPFDIEGELSFVRGSDTLRTIAIEIADTDSTRARGLMQRTEIPPDTGMLFVFDQPETPRAAFYMMNTPRSLDIQFYGPDSTLINIGENTTPFSLENVESEGPAQFVVEVPAGVSRSIGLVPGDRITWSVTDD